ncbi:LpqB family beta-propeller domain-containing protein [Gordonia shandongensis]|uniref:LpqB family beta-propeller domain-containing protein n=1 Tax=Gordonia shandongensis TaxID=376351 RepID=UPI00041E2A07|nr:LpqB family beta-propeller domain-containing protein [Gordonia shandongensis]
MTRRLIALLAALLAASVVLTGCVSIPDSSSPQPIQAYDRQRPTNIVPAPRKDDDPESVARNFVKAMSDPGDGHRAARRFLDPQAGRTWDDSGDLTVIRDVGVVIDERTENAVRLRVTGSKIGVLTPEGSLRQEDGDTVFALTLARRNGGQWRINGDVPHGTVTDSSQFLTAYRQVDLYYPDRTMTRLVADPRWFFGPDPDPSLIVGRLLAGPTPALSGAAGQGADRGSTLTSPVSVSGDDVSIALGNVADTDMRDRTVLAAQIAWTLDDAGVAGTYMITADGAPLVADHEDGWRTADVRSFDPDPDVDNAPTVHLVRDGALVRLAGGQAVPVPGEFGTSRDVRDAAISDDLSTMAVVVAREGRQVLSVGPYGGTTVEAVSGREVSRPSIGPDRMTGYALVDGKPVKWYFDPASGSARSVTLDVGAVAESAPGPITDLRVSPDGVRVALVVGGRLLVAVAVTNDRGVPALTGVENIAPTIDTPVIGAAWATAKTLYLAREGDESPVWRASITGTAPTELVSGNLKAPIRAIAASRRSVYVGDNRGVQQLGTVQARPDQYWTPVSRDAGAGSIPVIPER